MCDSIYMKRPEQANPQGQRVHSWLPGAGGEGWRVTAHGDGVSSLGDENVLELDRGGGRKTL